MNANPEFASFARLVESLTPWLDQLAIIGGPSCAVKREFFHD